MIRKIIIGLKYIARFCVAMIHVITGRKHKNEECDCIDNTENGPDGSDSE